MPAKKDQPQGASDTTIAGGRYVVNGVTVDANGKPLEEPAAPAEQPTSSDESPKE